MTESEKTTRKKRIDGKLKSSLLNWKIILYILIAKSNCAFVFDYALFVQGKLLGIIEAAGEDLGRKKETGEIGK